MSEEQGVFCISMHTIGGGTSRGKHTWGGTGIPVTEAELAQTVGFEYSRTKRNKWRSKEGSYARRVGAESFKGQSVWHNVGGVV